MADQENLRVAFDRYQSDCSRRAQLASEASRRHDLERELHARQQAERAAQEAERRARNAETQVRNASELARVAEDSLDSLVEGLETWQRQRSEARRVKEEARAEYAPLEALLQGRSIEQVEEEAERRAESARGGPPAGDGVRSMDLSGLRAELERLEHASVQARQRANRLNGQVNERSSTLPNVSEREEDLEAARAELERVRRLDRILERTDFHLRQAQERVHRDIAPRLAATLNPWLPHITNGRYERAAVDPETLEVQVCDPSGAWRPATGLSHGTAEQIYLLLRLALATHLTRPREICPILLDDVTTQCDAERTVAVCRLLQKLSQERQIVFFTQEEEVLRWAEQELTSDRDKLSLLNPPA